MKKSRLVIMCTSLVMMLLVGSMPLFALEDLDRELTSSNQDSVLIEGETTEHSENNTDSSEILDENDVDSLDEETESTEVLDEIERGASESDVFSNTHALEISETAALFADINKINTVDELQAAVSTAVDGDTLTLSETFVSDSALLNIDNKTITINGNNVTWDKGGITITGTGTLTLKNIKMDGTNTSTRLLIVSLSSGKLNIESMEFLNGKNGALDIKSPAATQVTISNSRISNNTSGTGPAIFMAGSSKVIINYTSIENNTGTAAGYEAGAIASKNFSGILEINNSLLANNINKAANSGVVGGGGGAVSIHYFSGTFNIKDSIFKGNSTNGADGSRASTYDGGAIYLFNMRNTASFNVQGSSFIENVAYDDGGAILIQTEGSGNGDVVDKITFKNNTFFGNKAYGVDVGAYSGGAIQIFANVGFTGELHTKAIFEGNTFVNNTVGGITDSASSLSGAALGLSMSSYKSSMKINLINNLFSGNYVLDKSGNEVAGYKTIYPLNRIENTDYTTTNLGIDTVSQEQEYDEIFGLYPVSLTSNYSNVTAGVDGVIIPTLSIMPEGLAENKNDTELTGLDQRYHSRHKDFGAIESTWIQYDANGGVFGLDNLNQFNGQSYYEPNENNTITNVYNIGFIGYSSSIQSDKDLKLSREGFEFVGWSDSADALVGNPIYDVSQAYTHKGENQVVYAVWKEVKTQYVVKYVDGVDEQAFPDQMYEVEDGELTPSYSGTPIRDGYIFTGWNPEVSNTVSADVVYVAQWEKVITPVRDFTVTYTDGSNGEAVFANQIYTVKEGAQTPSFVGTPLRDGYIFKGWNPAVSNTVSGDATYVAQWEKVSVPVQTFTVTYTDGSNNELYFKDEVYIELKDAETPLYSGTIIRDGYTFVGWNPDFSGFVTGDVTYVAMWVKNDEAVEEYFVRYTDGSSNQAYFKDEIYKVTKGSDTPQFMGSLSREGYTFIAWNPDFSNVVEGDVTYVAMWEKTDVITPTEPTQPEQPSKPSKPAEVLPSTGVKSDTASAMLTVSLITLGLVLIVFRNKSKNRYS